MLLGPAGAMMAAAAPLPTCALTWQARDPAALQWRLRNPGRQPLWVLTWGTPFEGWMQPYLTVTRDGVELPYRGPVVKRGDPGGDEYLRLRPGRVRGVRVDLTAAFDLAPPGHYRVEPRIVLHDVHPAVPGAPVARPRDAHQPVALDCPPVTFIR